MTMGAKYAFAFSGIEPDIDEYAIQFFQRHKSIFDSFLQSASDFIDINLENLLSEQSTQSIDPLTNQILTYTYGVAMSEVLKKENIQPSMVAGFSLGVYASLASIGIVSFFEGLKMVKKAYELMNDASSQGNFGMSAIVGLTEKGIQKLIDTEGLNSIERANTLSDTCTIYSGQKSELEILHKAAEAESCLSAVSLDVDIPYHHCRLLKNATKHFAEFLDTLEWSPSSIPVISSITQDLLYDTPSIKDFIAQNLSQPINWQKVIEKIDTEQNEFIAECGPGLTLTRNGRFIEADVKYINVKNIQKKLDL